MKIWTRFGFSHTIVVDKDSKFRGVFAKTSKLPGINMHLLSGKNYDPMLIECVDRFPNASLTIFCNEQGTNKFFQEGVLVSLYAWNSASMPGSGISWSPIIVGREFHFPIDFSAWKHLDLTSSPGQVESFTTEQVHLLSACRLVTKELIHHHHNYHCKLVNSFSW